MSSGTLLGAPVDISGQRLTQWINSLASAWRELTAREAGDLESDLRDLEPLFGPKSRIRTIRSGFMISRQGLPMPTHPRARH